ncbi:uncharacterized protein BDV17DRAFT_109919 [Aspergillus undulatus]|uniref:uncharacterized protein n=1 Tax=Aspergillus undulatus TaxID=1810928 RepID=UPI003CCD10DC
MYSSMQQGRLLWSLARPCRFVAHRRYPAVVTSPLRRFHLSQTWRSSIPTDPNDPRNLGSNNNPSQNSALNGNQSTRDSESAIEASPERLSARDSSGPYGSALRRALRSKRRLRASSSHTVEIPKWFLDLNLLQPEIPLAKSAQDTVAIRPPGKSEQKFADTVTSGGSDEKPPGADGELSLPRNQARYALTDATWAELCASAKAGLRLPPTKYAKDPSARKSHLALHYPGTDGILFLDAVVKRLSKELNAALVTLNAQDIAQLCVEQDLANTGYASPIRLLGYEVFRPPVPDSAKEAGSGVNEEDQSSADPTMPPNLRSLGLDRPKFITIESSREPGDIPLPGLSALKSFLAGTNLPDNSNNATSQSSPDSPRERWTQLLQKILSQASKVSEQSATLLTINEESPNDFSGAGPEQTRDLIVQVQDYNEIESTREGSMFLSLLQKLIQDRRENGHRVLFIGTASQELSPESNSLNLLQNSFDDQFSQTVVVTPAMEPEEREDTFSEDRKIRTCEINIRHLKIMLQTKLGDEIPAQETDRLRKDLIKVALDKPNLSGETGDEASAGMGRVLGNRHLVDGSGLVERYWSYNQVHWVATLALGSMRANESFSFKEHILRGLEMLIGTNHARDQWLQKQSPKAKPTETISSRAELISGLIKRCTPHEKKLLSGVVDANSIRTTFSDVHVPPETIDALKTLTSLSLVRPDAFRYGVLATDKIPGLLLYGPPGTGKTLLAKAVARDSGATVLEVSGSEIYDKYVGEGEKNIKAIFTLARKLNPCVVFIDEADAIFGSRSAGRQRASHRELVNQFLREWDGMNSLETFIMVATNRPFDLDDAVLRRLPRRLLVDLPTEKDRQSILKIHLKGEHLDPSVDLAELARHTPLYSGSDLKNLCVAAALACVREENALAQQHTGDEPYKYPARRTLTWTHFTRGMEEISASISEDMSSLGAIRKFDEQYGARKGRRKKSSGWGFNAPRSEEAASDAARVRS